MPTVTHCGQTIEYQIERKKVKHVNLRIAADGQVKVSAPRRVSEAFIRAFVQEKADWILQRLQKRALKDTQKKVQPKAETGATLFLLGKPYRLFLQPGRQSLLVEDGLCILFTGQAAPETALTGQLRALYRALCSQRLPAIYERFAAYAIPFPEIKLRKMKRCWGTCQPNTAVVTLNPVLVHAPLSCTDYILTHELAHLVHPDHSARFYRLLDEIYPDWAVQKRLLADQHLL